MASPDRLPTPENDEIQSDSLNMDIYEPTEAVDDTTVRPMPDCLRKALKLPPYDQALRKPGTNGPAA